MMRAKISGAGSIRRDFIGVTLPRIAAPWLDRLVWRIPGHDGERVAYLTFDDGPTDEGTERLIDLLDDYEAQATFFLLGSQVDQHAHLRDTIEGAGRRVGVHGYAHLDAWTTRSAIVLSDLGKAVRAVRPSGRFWYRPPYGHITPRLMRAAESAGGRVAMWDILGGEFYSRASAAEVANRICRFIRPGSIITLHDNEPCISMSIDITRAVLDRLVPEGWTFRHLPDP